MDFDQINRVFAALDRELWIVTAAAGSERGGLIATFVNQASIVPTLPRVLVGVARQHRTWELIQESGAFALHLIDETLLPMVWTFGLSSSRTTRKFEHLQFEQRETGSPILADALAWLDCRVEASLDTGDRTVFLAEVVAGEMRRDQPPLTMKRMLSLAPQENRAELKEQMLRDAAIDAEAIRQWREKISQGDA